MWTHHLLSARVRDIGAESKGRGRDEVHVLTAEDSKSKKNYSFVERVLDRPSRVTIDEKGEPTYHTGLFIQDCGDRYYIGVDGRICDHLEESPYAYENTIVRGAEKVGRPIPFTHGFFTEKGAGTKIPDFRELLARQKTDLEEILRRANAGEEPVDIGLATFSTPRTLGTDWDKIATEVELGKHSGRLAIFSLDGTLKEWIEAEIAPPQPAPRMNSAKAAEEYRMPPDQTVSAASHLRQAQKKTTAGFAERISAAPKRNTSILFATVAGVSLLAVGVGTAWYLKTHTSRRNQSAGAQKA